MNVVLKIEALAAAPDSVMIPIGPDMVPTEFLKCGAATWIAPCGFCQTGIIETDSPDYAAAMCEACEDKLDSEAVQAPPVPKVHFPIPAPRPAYSLTVSSGRLPLPKFEDRRPFYVPSKTPECQKCGRFMAPSMDGQTFRTCGVCRSVDKREVDHRCRECNADMTGSHEHRIYCLDCARGRAVTGQKRMTATSRTTKARRAEKAAAAAVDTICIDCLKPIPNAPRHTKRCPGCRDLNDKEIRRAGMARKRAKSETEMETTND
ncbi:hypothetical protein [Aestuariivirga sp.]|uniref:hypothetical protein n=1 Tax=Aestuariivirga sp. TaxID=2650926 RepID=UPI00359473D3